MASRASKARKHEWSLFPAPEGSSRNHYFYLTQRPWPSLVFILPMLLIYEVGTYVRHGGAPNNLVATWLVQSMINLLGASGAYFPGLLAVAILLAWHLAARDPWRFDLFALPNMLGESLIYTLPLLVFDRILHTAQLAGSAAQQQWIDKVIRSFGAGIYEELVFRLICITVLTLLLVDMLGLPRTASAVFIILASAALFAAQHHPPLGADPFEPVKYIFRTAAGCYLAGLFVFRGFGIAAGCHAFYNVLVVTLEATRAQGNIG